MRLVEISGRSCFQTLLKKERMLVRTNTYLRIAHLCCLNAWTINIDLKIQGCSRNPANASNPDPPLDQDRMEPNRYPKHLVSVLDEVRIDKRREE
jgi:hypothetical protein